MRVGFEKIVFMGHMGPVGPRRHVNRFTKSGDCFAFNLRIFGCDFPFDNGEQVCDNVPVILFTLFLVSQRG